MGTGDFLTDTELDELLTADEFWYDGDPEFEKELEKYEEMRKTLMGE